MWNIWALGKAATITDNPISQSGPVEQPTNPTMPDKDTTLTEDSYTDNPLVDKPFAEEPLADNPLADNPLVKVDKPLVDNSLANNSLVDKPLADEPLVDKPLADESSVKEHSVDNPLVVESLAEKSVVDESLAENPVADNLISSPAEKPLTADAHATIDDGHQRGTPKIDSANDGPEGDTTTGHAGSRRNEGEEDTKDELRPPCHHHMPPQLERQCRGLFNATTVFTACFLLERHGECGPCRRLSSRSPSNTAASKSFHAWRRLLRCPSRNS